MDGLDPGCSTPSPDPRSADGQCQRPRLPWGDPARAKGVHGAEAGRVRAAEDVLPLGTMVAARILPTRHGGRERPNRWRELAAGRVGYSFCRIIS